MVGDTTSSQPIATRRRCPPLMPRMNLQGAGGISTNQTEIAPAAAAASSYGEAGCFCAPVSDLRVGAVHEPQLSDDRLGNLDRGRRRDIVVAADTQARGVADRLADRERPDEHLGEGA